MSLSNHNARNKRVSKNYFQGIIEYLKVTESDREFDDLSSIEL